MDLLAGKQVLLALVHSQEPVPGPVSARRCPSKAQKTFHPYLQGLHRPVQTLRVDCKRQVDLPPAGRRAMMGAEQQSVALGLLSWISCQKGHHHHPPALVPVTASVIAHPACLAWQQQGH